MGTVLREHSITNRVTDLADRYAVNVADTLPSITSEEQLRRVLSGAFLSFLRDILISVTLDDDDG